MKQLTCEMCGSTDLLKQDGVFVCQTCGTKYSIEDAKKMMVEGTVKVDNSEQIENFLSIALTALNGDNAWKCIQYCDKILEINSNNSAALILKARALIKTYQLDESFECIKQAINLCTLSEDDKKFVAQSLYEKFSIHYNIKELLGKIYDGYNKELLASLSTIFYNRESRIPYNSESIYELLHFVPWELTAAEKTKIYIDFITNRFISILEGFGESTDCDCSKINYESLFKDSEWFYNMNTDVNDNIDVDDNIFLEKLITEMNINSDDLYKCSIKAATEDLNTYIDIESFYITENNLPHNGENFISFVEGSISYIKKTIPDFELDSEHQRLFSTIQTYWANNDTKSIKQEEKRQNDAEKIEEIRSILDDLREYKNKVISTGDNFWKTRFCEKKEELSKIYSPNIEMPQKLREEIDQILNSNIATPHRKLKINFGIIIFIILAVLLWCWATFGNGIEKIFEFLGLY